MSAEVDQLRQETLFEEEIVAATYVNVVGLGWPLLKTLPVEPKGRHAHRDIKIGGTVIAVSFEERDGKLVRIENVMALAVSVDD